MSISLPNGTILTTPSQPQLSAAVTRILHLTNFSPELKTRDIHLLFKEWENEKGGFKIKWLDDVNALAVFNDATIAKRAYLSLLLHAPAAFPPPAQIRPYDRPDAAAIIAQLSARALGHRASMSSAMSFSQAQAQGRNGDGGVIPGLPESHGRAASISSGLSGFVMPTFGSGAGASSFNQHPGHHSRSSISNVNSASASTPNGTAGLPSSNSRSRNIHNRSGSASASSSWSRGGFGAGGGVLNFPSSSSGRLPTHSESSADPSRSSSSEEDTIVIMDGGAGYAARTFGTGNGNGHGTGSGTNGARRDSLSAMKAMREVEKALAHVDTRG